MKDTLLFVWSAALVVALGGLATPVVKGGWIALAVVLVIAGLAFARRAGRLSAVLNLPDPLRVVMVTASVVVILAGSAELAVAALSELKLVTVFQPMATVLPARTDDWRVAHITADDFREPDPDLLWRPVRRPPYNEQGFKGPLIDPSDTSRFLMVTYGDSNTDGPDRGGWPEQLQALLRNRGVAADVVNAGVAGYSSFQGLRRFGQDAPRLDPDVIVVSFGWNDAASTTAGPDSQYVPPGPVRREAQRALLRFKAYRLLVHLVSEAPPEDGLVQPRVSPEEYAGNLQGFVDAARQEGARVVLATRPHRETVETLRATTGWRADVPAYNGQVRKVAAANPNVLLLDVQQQFDGEVHYFIDECHFTIDGHRRMAERLLEALTDAQWIGTATPDGSPG